MDLNQLRLCGGTFLTLLCTAKIEDKLTFGKERSSSDSELLFSLLNLFNEGYTKRTIKMESLKSRTPEYKYCVRENLTQLKKKELISSFDESIKKKYTSKLSIAEKLVKDNLNTNVDETLKKAIKSIIDLIANDETIKDDALFYVVPSGNTITKKELKTLKEVNVAAFILGVFHYIVVNIKDNRIGRTTIESWIPNLGERTGTTYEIHTELGNDFNKLLLTFASDAIEVPEETTEEQEDTIEDDVGFETPSDKYTNENNKTNFNFQIGRNNFNNIGSMTFIDKD